MKAADPEVMARKCFAEHCAEVKPNVEFWIYLTSD